MSKIYYDGSGELHITDIHEAVEKETKSFDRIITVCQDSIDDNISDKQKYNYFCMSDGPDDSHHGDHSYEMFSNAADTVWRALYDGETVLIHCHKGQSRSVSVSVAALGRLLGVPRYKSYDVVRYYRPQANPDTVLMGHAEEYINRNS
jgi:protein-tyrosine phosphatase